MAKHDPVWVTSETFESLIHDHEMIFLDFWAEWCAPCQQFSVIYDRVAAAHPTILFAKVDIAQAPTLAETFHIRSVPHLIVFKQGIAIYSEAGSMPESTLIELVYQTLVVDVSAIRAELDKT